MYDEPPVQPLAALESVRALSEIEQLVTGAETEALPGQEHEGLQQSQ